MTLAAYLMTLATRVLIACGLTSSVASALAPSHPALVRANYAAVAIDNVTTRLIANPVERKTWASIAFVMSAHESSWRANPDGYNDNGTACGALQVHNPEKYVAGATCKKVRANFELGIEVGVTMLLKLEAQCGSKLAALTAFRTDGMCPKKGWVLPELYKRCEEAGLTPDCRPPGA